MKVSTALLLTLPLFACEGESLMENAGRAVDDTGDEIAETIDEASEDAEEEAAD